MKYPIGIQTFEKIREDGYVYIDKTATIYDLVNFGQYFFLSRPRRFGKSLLLSTLEAYFSGRKDLFKGLVVDSLESEWIQHPVIHIDLNVGDFKSVDAFDRHLDFILQQNEEKFGIKNHVSDHVHRFANIIMRAAQNTGQKVVILIDEYDKPMLQNFADEALQNRLRNELYTFYSPLKSCDKYIRFAMLTGVTRFGKQGIFSGLNNIKDISFLPRFADICGITKHEIHQYLHEGLEFMAESLNCDVHQAEEKLRTMYDGYRFTRNDVKVFNPYSLLNALMDGSLGYYWSETGTPTFLVDILRRNNYDLSDLEGVVADERRLGSINFDASDPIPVIYQSGYLTIKNYDSDYNDFTLGFPNEEVRSGFFDYLLPFYVRNFTEQSRYDLRLFQHDMAIGDAEGLMQRLQSFTADIPYDVQADCEKDFQNLLYITLSLASVRLCVERSTSDGRIDMVAETKKFVYLFEFKIDSSAQSAIDQIESKSYALPWSVDHRTVIKIGANFSTSMRRLTEYEIRQSCS